MLDLQIPHERLLRQRIAGEGIKNPAEVVRWMGAVQSQDYAAGKWAVGLRTASCTEADVESAFSAGEILRTHVMRPTWHLVAQEDIRWMQALTSPRVNAINAYQYRQLELDATLFKRTNAALERALRDGRQRTRAELGLFLADAGIRASGLRLTYIVLRAELDAVICSGGRRGKQFTYALVEERAPHSISLNRDESLALLTQRYFRSHGPATLKDYAWWSGLASTDLQRGLEMARSKLVCEEIDGRNYWMSHTAPEPRFPRGTAYLLPNYDEYIVGYTDRSAIFDSAHVRHLDARHSPFFQNTIVHSGRIIGRWKRTVGKESLGFDAKLFIEPRKAEIRALGLAAKRLAKFTGLPIIDFRM
jgi:hypothetical protein